MTKTQWLSLTRHFLTFVGGVLITQGVIDDAVFTEMFGATMTLVGGIWGIIDKKQNTDETE